MKHRKPRKGIPLIPAFVENPFVSEAQRRACYAQDDPRWDCHEWSQATKGVKLPQRITKNKLRLVRNRGKGNRGSARNPLKLDPTRTVTLRRSFFQELRKQFARLKGMVVRLIDHEDVFGLKPRPTLIDLLASNISSLPPNIAVPVVRQSNTYACGAAAYAAVAQFWGKEPDNEKEAIEELGTSSSDGTSPEAIDRVAKLQGLVAISHYGMSLEQLSDYLSQGVPVILSLQAWGTPAQHSNDESGHYVVATGMTPTGVRIMDPSSGYRSIPFAQLEEDWHDVGETPLEQYDHLGIAIAPQVVIANCQPGQIRDVSGKCGPGIGISIPRSKMPQIKSSDLDAFISYAQDKGVDVQHMHALITDLKPTQANFRQERVDSLPADSLNQPLIVSRDDYILDGTHRWIKAWQQNKDSIVPILQIDKPLQPALELMRGFPGAKYTENSAEPDPELQQEREMIALTKKAYEWKKTNEEGSPDYGQLFFKSETQELHYVMADGDSSELEKWLKPALEAVPLIRKVTMGDEWSPKMDDGWVQVFPRYRNWVHNTRWQFNNDPEKIRAFQAWLAQQIKTTLTGQSQEDLWNKYIQAGYAKGAGRSFDDVRKAQKAAAIGDQGKLDFYNGTREQFLRSSFAQPVSTEKVQLLAGRAFDELENVTDDMSNRMSRTLTDGLTQGKSPHDIADDLVDAVDISTTRARRIANTEIIRAHAEGQLTSLEQMGVEEVGVAVEWSTSGLDTVDKRGNPISPCARCKAMQGVVLKISEARGMIPLHPECKCCFLPSNVGEDDSDQKDTKKEIEEAADDAGIDIDISTDRPESILDNANPDQARDEKGRFTSSGESLNEHEQTAQKSADKTSELFGIPKKDIQFHRIEGDRTYGEHGSDIAHLVNVHTGQPINRQLNMHKHLERKVTEGEHLAAHETVHQAYSTDSDLGKQTQEKLDKVNAEYGHSVSMYGAMSGHFENLIELGAIYSHSPEALKKYSPEMYNIAHEWATKLRGNLTSNANPNHDEHGRFAALPDSSLKRMAKKAGLDHKGSRAELIQRLHEHVTGTTDTGNGPKGDRKSAGSTRIHAGISPEIPPVVETKPVASPSTFDKAHAAQSLTQSAGHLGRENYNLTHLGDLRSAHPELSKEQFDTALHHARAQGKISLTPAEGRSGVSQRDKDSAVYEHDQSTGRHDKMMLYASVRNTLLSDAVDNAFCATGIGGGIDPSCSPHGPAGSRVSDPNKRHKGNAPKALPFKPPPPKKGKKGEGMGKRPVGDASQTKQGDLAEAASTKLGFRNILPEGKRTFTAKEVAEIGSSVDLEYDHSGKLYELKMCKTTSTEYRLKAKAEEKVAKQKFADTVKAQVHTLIGVHDVDKGEIHFYASKEPGLTGAEVSDKHFDYLGKARMG